MNNNCFYGQSNYLLSGIQANPEPACYTVSDFSTEQYFDNTIFLEDNAIPSVGANFQKASKKISKVSGQESSKKVMRKKHNKARNPWTPKEDAQLIELMKKYGQSWAMISSVMEGRTGKQIRDRYLNKLRPNIKCGDWSPQEDELLVKLLNEVGNRWSLIANQLPGRTEGQVKNRFYSSIKKRLQCNGTLLSQESSSKNVSETGTSFAASPEAEENKFDFGGFEFDTTMLNGCTTFFNEEPALQHATYTNKGAYAFDDDTYSEGSTTQSSNSQTESVYRNADPACMISYQPQSAEPFFLPPIENDNQIDDMLEKVTSFIYEKSTASSDIDSFFSDDLKREKNNFSNFDVEADRLTQLSRRKAYLELVLAKTLKEIKSL